MVIRSDGTGLTMAQGYLSDAETAIYSAAGDLWDAEFSAHDYVDGACFDLRYQVSMIGERGIWQARRTARRILTERRRDVLDLAARLHRERQLVFA